MVVTGISIIRLVIKETIKIVLVSKETLIHFINHVSGVSLNRGQVEG